MLKSCHALDIPFVFGTLDAPMMDMFAGADAAASALSATMMDAWIAFARTGSPSTPAAGEWPHEDERAAWDGRVAGRMSAA